MALLNNITVNFIYQGRFIGEMQFQYQEQTEEQKKKYHANHFLYGLERAREKIEMLAAMNHEAAFMSKNDLFNYRDRITLYAKI